MRYDPNKHHRRSIRLAGYDYSRAGAYFVSIVAKNRKALFGQVDGGIRLNEIGEWVATWWCEIPRHFPKADIDEFVVMPNHMHGIVVIFDGVGAGIPDVGAGIPRPYLGQIIAYFKYQSTKQINAARETPGVPVWQRNYYEHIIRNVAELERTRQYIQSNPLRWAQDIENPARSDAVTR